MTPAGAGRTRPLSPTPNGVPPVLTACLLAALVFAFAAVVALEVVSRKDR